MVTLKRRHGVVSREVDSRSRPRANADDQRTPEPDHAGRITHENIETRAYDIYRGRQRDGIPGDAQSDWLRAERELSSFVPDPSVASDVPPGPPVGGDERPARLN